MRIPIDWLLEGPAFVRYRALLDLEGASAGGTKARAAYREMAEDPRVASCITEVNAWERQPVITRHTDAVHPLHKLVFCADLGIGRDMLAPAVESILGHQSDEGPFPVRIRVPRAFGGDDVPKWDWVATDAPLVLFALLRLGVTTRPVMRGVEHILSRCGDVGFPCFASASMGRFKGPGRKGDPCPYANLIILRMIAELPDRIDSPQAHGAVEMLLGHWGERKRKKYYLFGIGTDFAKLKAPLIWYDILHYLDTLSRFPFARKDPRLLEAADLLSRMADEEGRFSSASVWAKWKGWEFCQKREPSRWVSLLAHRALRRLGEGISR